ncbi:MAG TPA: potassium transporter [Gammaproteobacteria bacterium]|nr:potassium transporter [Gammaproteobacteria bacterium]
MQFLVIQRMIGLLLMIFSVTTLPPMLVSIIYRDGSLQPFLYTFAITLVAGILLWLPVKNQRRELHLRDGFLVVVMFWTVLSLFGAIPFILADHPHLSITNAVFESLSGLTTTGATVLQGLDQLPKSILYYRQQLQWLGGMGIIVLAVAIMPMLGIGGMQLYRAETPGPIKSSKLMPRITETARALWFVYLTLTVACGIGYWMAGMDAFDAVAHSFSTVSIGGFSTHDANMGYFIDKPMVEVVAIVFMFLSGVNFSLHFRAWRTRNLRNYLFDSEFKTYVALMLTACVVTTGYLYYKGLFASHHETLIHGIFQVVSIGTTTGFTTYQYHLWPDFLLVILMFTSFIGACAGSTGGGMKVIRFLLLLRQGLREIMRVIHPNAVVPIKIGGKAMPLRVVESVWGFFSAYVVAFVAIMLIMMMTGLDQVTAFSAVAATMNNLGPGLGDVALNYASLTDAAKWVLCFAMLLGRLEIFTLLVFLTPSFWRK